MADDRAIAEGVAAGEDWALRVNRTLVVPIRYQRAEDAAETLRPLIEHTYGPGAVVVPHPASNHLLIYLPPTSERERLRPNGSSVPAR